MSLPLRGGQNLTCTARQASLTYQHYAEDRYKLRSSHIQLGKNTMHCQIHTLAIHPGQHFAMHVWMHMMHKKRDDS
jgi:hypothetical protein